MSLINQSIKVETCKLYNFERIWDFLLNYNQIPEQFIVGQLREYDKYKEELDWFKKKIEWLPKTFIRNLDKRQYYQRDFYFNNDATFGFEIEWDIQKAKELIREHNLQIVEFSVNQFIDIINPADLDPKVLANPVINSEPIVVMYYDPINMHIPIDGNHRVLKTYRINENARIQGYLLSPDIHMQAMACDLFRYLYKLHHNITVISNYMMGNKRKIKRFSKINFIKRMQSINNSLYRLE
ncbi:hypothetical protein G9G54_14095 [Paenibacillus sp. EKM212P]|uniref:hypothetical protein n=1 Tax=Paenibacillus sp. EKM212P TaxID=1683680 RepID=UPI0013EAC10B|nr:hypothetical protein [Paenibacillus sp. EKM212P]KAF6578398.1 hypothetical protein G9G54_14095 [Paenibacillus sp. EKM212P]